MSQDQRDSLVSRLGFGPRQADESLLAALREIREGQQAILRELAEIRRMLPHDQRPNRYADRPERAERPERPAFRQPVTTLAWEGALAALFEVVSQLRTDGAARLFPAINEEIRVRYGELPNSAIPFDKFKDFLQEAQRRGQIRLVRIGSLDHIVLADESIQHYIEQVRSGELDMSYLDAREA